MKKTEYKLNNGLKVLFLDTQAFPSIATLLLVGAGSRYENQKNNGIAHFFEHMAFKGSQKYPSSLQIATLLDSLGSQQNAFTGKDHTGYWIKAPLEHFPTVIDVLADMIMHSLLASEEIEREKGVIIEEINMYEDLPQYKVWDVFESLLFPKNALGYPTTGTKATVSSFNRQTFTQYMDSLYRPNNCVLVVAGGIKGQEKQMLAQIKEKFSSWKKAKVMQFTDTKPKQRGPEAQFFVKDTQQAHFVLGYPSFSRYDKNKYVLNVLATLLGGGMSSRLFYELRERRGLCYYIQSGMELYQETGYVFTRAGVSVKKDKIEQAVELIIKEQQKITNAKFTDKELSKAKEMIKGRTILALEDSFDLASFFGKRLLFGQNEPDLATILAKIDKVNLKQVRDLALEIYQPDKLNFALISPHNKITI